MKTNPDKDTELHDKINRETARVKWSELERHFASGAVIWVSEELDLIDVALRIAHDDKDSIGTWMAAGSVAKVSDTQAQAWTAADATLWASVVSPFVLVQPQRRQLH
ncbi:DUF2288 domain-containing protein [Massilia sp. MS-15]|uniref:DUF2288 domain-containing protein n=1 Tax=Massilia sp. MS-15 TaxID=2878200 RepID=UPI001CD19572|nr:DUF2288 domain-containing protein [Massilia sp. MS-15]MCA1245877.1 DUF2288 domain-containing protein [Massilia sp. MS-15]